MMKGFVDDIEALTEQNDEFRHVLYTGHHLQLVLMTIPSGGEIGAEVHDANDQFFRVEEGQGEVEIDGSTHRVRPGSGIVVPAGATHNIRNTGTEPLRLYSLYGPPHHEDGVIHETRNDAEQDDEEFDGETTED
jgi:mannose-6-phosphate isomerase-like protein (cupin superfamily)